MSGTASVQVWQVRGGQDFPIPVSAGPGGFKFCKCRAEAAKRFQLDQDS